MIAESDRIVTIDLPCTACGYNLRTLTMSERCPECGGPVRTSVLGRAHVLLGRNDAIWDYPQDKLLALRQGCWLSLASSALMYAPYFAPRDMYVFHSTGRAVLLGLACAAQVLSAWAVWRQAPAAPGWGRVLLRIAALAWPAFLILFFLAGDHHSHPAWQDSAAIAATVGTLAFAGAILRSIFQFAWLGDAGYAARRWAAAVAAVLWLFVGGIATYGTSRFATSGLIENTLASLAQMPTFGGGWPGIIMDSFQQGCLSVGPGPLIGSVIQSLLLCADLTLAWRVSAVLRARAAESPRA